MTAADPRRAELPYIPRRDAGRYEPGNVNLAGYAGQYEALKRILGLGVENIFAHAKPMCDRLKRELPAVGYKLITPADAAGSIVVVQAKDLKAAQKKLERANIQVTLVGENRIRISPALYNNMGDIEKLLSALG